LRYGLDVVENFDISAQDDVIASRTSALEWSRILDFRSLPKFLDLARQEEHFATPEFAQLHAVMVMLGEQWRFQMAVHAVHLVDTRTPEDAHSGLTVGNLQQRCTKLDLASPGRVKSFLDILGARGLVIPTRSLQDRRVVHLEPSPVFLAIIEHCMNTIIGLVDAVDPGVELGRKNAVYPAFGREMRRIGTQRLIDGWNPEAAFQEIHGFSSREGGWMLLYHCVAIILRNGDRSIPVSVGLEMIAKNTGGSRSNLRKILYEAFDRGLLEASPRNGSHILLSEKLLCAFFAYLASYYAHYRWCGVEAAAALTSADRRGQRDI
jgi:DNA-binding MarR family transcriptional regulator